jgi:hypothetical protein
LASELLSGVVGEDVSNQQNREPAQGHAGRRQHEAEIAEAILDYLGEHPRAMDTLEGIAEWWLARYRVSYELEAVKRVVRHLTNEGLLEEISGGQSPLYHLKARNGGQYVTPGSGEESLGS